MIALVLCSCQETMFYRWMSGFRDCTLFYNVCTIKEYVTPMICHNFGLMFNMKPVLNLYFYASCNYARKCAEIQNTINRHKNCALKNRPCSKINKSILTVIIISAAPVPIHTSNGYSLINLDCSMRMQTIIWVCRLFVTGLGSSI